MTCDCLCHQVAFNLDHGKGCCDRPNYKQMGTGEDSGPKDTGDVGSEGRTPTVGMLRMQRNQTETL